MAKLAVLKTGEPMVPPLAPSFTLGPEPAAAALSLGKARLRGVSSTLGMPKSCDG